MLLLLLRHLNTAFDVANGIRIFVDLALILRPQLQLEVGQLPGHRIQNALVLLQPSFASGSIGAATVAEQLLEDRAWIPFHGQRLRGAPPGERVEVGAAQIAGARAGVGREVHADLERRQRWSFLREVPSEQLVNGDVGDNFDFVLASTRRAGEKRSGGAGVDVVPTRLEAGQNSHLFFVRGQRLHDGREFESGAFALPPVQYSMAIPLGT